MIKAFLSLGSNLGNRNQVLQEAIQQINKLCGEVKLSSSLYETEPWGFESPNPFTNQVIEIETELAPANLLKQTQQIEKELGRNSKSINKEYSDRIIDIDILYYNSHRQHSASLTIPHPLMHERRFVLEPLNEIAPDFIHPVFEQNTTYLLQECEDRSDIQKMQ